MWTRKELKQRAKAVLKNIYWKALLISLVIGWAQGGGGSGGSSNYGDSGESVTTSLLHQNTYSGPDPYLITTFVIIIVIAFAFRIFLGYHLEVGGRKYFIKSAQYQNNKKCFRFSFKHENYRAILLTMLLKGVQNFLWYLLLIIPGFVKTYAYSMVPYILADNPNIGCKKAIELSKRMTNGQKWNMFVLDLSFFWWYVLGIAAFFIGLIFLLPYLSATKAELYLVLRRNALENGFCSYEDLLLDHTDPYENSNPNSDPVFE